MLFYSRASDFSTPDNDGIVDYFKVKPQTKDKEQSQARPRGTDRRATKPDHNGDGDKVLASLESLLEVALKERGAERTAQFLSGFTERLRESGVHLPRVVSTPYINTIPPEQQVPFPGDWAMEVRI